MAQFTAISGGRYPMKHRATAETFNRHFHQLNDTGNNGNKQDKAQEAESTPSISALGAST